MFDIYITQRNADQTEGRGPMVNDAAFRHLHDAELYIDKRPGVMGHVPPDGRIALYRAQKARGGYASYGDWDIVKITVYDSISEAKSSEERALIKTGLSKLHPDEIAALGLTEFAKAIKR